MVSVEPRAVTVRQGESVSFRCRVGNDAQGIHLEWRRANNQALPGQWVGQGSLNNALTLYPSD